MTIDDEFDQIENGSHHGPYERELTEHFFDYDVEIEKMYIVNGERFLVKKYLLSSDKSWVKGYVISNQEYREMMIDELLD